MPTRFHYAPVQSASYSLTPVEILLSTDAELNQYMGIKKYAPYRDRKQEGWDHSRNTRLSELKDRLKGRWWGADTYGGSAEGAAGPSGEGKQKKRKGKKERMKLKAAVAENEVETDVQGDEERGSVQDTHLASTSFKKRKSERGDDELPGEETQASEGSRKKRKRRHKKLNSSTDE